MKKSFNHNRVYYTAMLDDWLVIVQDCSGKQVQVFNTESWLDWEKVGVEFDLTEEYISEKSMEVLNHAVSVFTSQ